MQGQEAARHEESEPEREAAPVIPADPARVERAGHDGNVAIGPKEPPEGVVLPGARPRRWPGIEIVTTEGAEQEKAKSRRDGGAGAGKDANHEASANQRVKTDAG